MTGRTGKILQGTRIGSQILFLLGFYYLFFYSTGSVIAFFYSDPLMLFTSIAAGNIISLFLLSLITLFLTLLLGRFFCGWVCPLGAVHQFFSWVLAKYNKKPAVTDRLKIKYIILIALIISGIMGTNAAGWLDPFSLLTRSSAALAGYDFQSGLRHYSDQSVLIPLLFIIVILMNSYKRRFFCSTLCPLGALYGLTARIGIFRIKTTAECTSCGLCSYNCQYNGSPASNYLKSECLVCFNCARHCPSDGIEVRFELPRKKQRTGVNLGRRILIGSAVTGLVLAVLPKSSIRAKTKARHPFLRPPGAVNEEEFLEKCARCGNCVQACPTSFIQPAFLETGIEGLWTPVLNAQAGACTYDCNKCSAVCPAGAIRKLTLEEKQNFKIGTAVVIKDRCYTYAGGFNCSACFDHCPTPEKAIGFHEVESCSFTGRNSMVKQIYVIPDLCIGCGICENICPRKDMAGIIIMSDDEVRESVTGDI